MYIKDYIQATYAVIRDKGDEAATLNALKEYLKKRGLLALYPSILRGLLEKIERKGKSMRPRVVIAREEDLKKHKAEITSLLEKIGSTEDHKVEIDKNIIGGVIVQNRDKRIDTSYKTVLLHTYRRLLGGDIN